LPIDEAALNALSNLLAAVDHSAPSVTKYRAVEAWLADRLGLNADRVGAYYVSKAGNFNVRFRQPGVSRRQPVLGVAVVPSRGVADASVVPAGRIVAGSGVFRAVAFCYRREDGAWRVGPVVAGPAPDLDPTLGALVEPEEVQVVYPPPIAAGGEPADGLAAAAEEPSYDHARFTEETGIGEELAREWTERLRRKGQLVLQGPPGSGKTFVAERLARLFVAGGDGVVDKVQFHASWTYEDFVAGLAPVVRPGEGLSYEIRPGRFLDFCELAAESPESPSVLIVDEFNRADVARVFGELLHLLEYRDEEVRLANGPGDGRFAIPRNVHLIATMNTADRSLALLDHALRRRFSFVRLLPDHGVLIGRLERDGVDPAPLVALLRELDRDIADLDYLIGISFFMRDGAALPARMHAIWDGEVLPYVRELFHGDPARAAKYEWAAVRREWLAAWYPEPGP